MSFLAVVYLILLILYGAWGGWSFDRTNPRVARQLGGIALPWLLFAVIGWAWFGHS